MFRDLYEVLVKGSNLSGFVESLVVPVCWVLALSLVGVVVVSFLNLERRPHLVPAIPAVGLLMLALAWSNLGMFVGVRHPMMLAILCLYGLRRFWTLDANTRRTVVRWARTMAGGVVVVLGVSLMPMLRASDGNVLNHPTTNHDAFYYASNQAWIEHHSYPLRPSVKESATTGSDAPGFSSAVVASDFNVRQGEGLVAAFLSPLQFGSETTWFPSRTTWLVVAFALMTSAASLVGIGRLASATSGIVGAMSWQAVFQVYNQNAAAVIGFALVPALIGLAVSARREPEGRRLRLQESSVVFAGLLVLYSELAPIAVIAFVVFLGARNLLTWNIVRSLLFTAVVSLMLAPYATLQAIRTNLRVGGLANSLGAPLFWNHDSRTIVTNLFGVSSVQFGHEIAAKLLLVFVLAGLLLLCFHLKSIAPAVLSAVFLLLWINLGMNQAFYSVDRLVQTNFPVFVWLGCVGLVLSKPVAGKLHVASIPVVCILVANIAAPVSYLAGQRSLDWRTTSSTLPQFAVDAARTSENGSELMVLTGNYLDRLWLPLYLREFPASEYAWLNPDYMYGVRWFDDSRQDRYLLSDVAPVGESPVLVEAGDGLSLWKFSGQTAAALAGVSLNASPAEGGGLSIHGEMTFRILSWSPAQRVSVRLRVVGIPEGTPLVTESTTQTAGWTGIDEVEVNLSPGSTQLRFDWVPPATHRWTVNISTVLPD